MLSRDDLINAIADGSLKIYPFEEENLTGIGYNLSTTYFAFSINRGILLTVHQQTTNEGVNRYVIIPGNDTVLFFSKEYVEVDRSMAGTFHAKVSRVCQGLGHISTTLDPAWKGQMIISINNPTAKAIRFDLDTNSGNIMTMLLHKLDTAVTGDHIHNNNQGRCDLLLEHFAKPLPNKEYQNKHLQLESFVIGEFADSLNGYDEFLNSGQSADKYTQKACQLIELKERLTKERRILQEDRYMMGSHGVYYCLRNESEKELLQNCTLFQIYSKTHESIRLIDELKKEDLYTVDPVIEKYINIIDYELKTINHIRRIIWQNKKIEQFAGEASPLVRLRQQESDRIRLLKFWGPLLGVLIVAAIVIFLLWKFNVSSNACSVIATIAAPILALAVQFWYDGWKKG